MVLRSITVSGVKCFRDEFSVGRFGDGLNMVFGGNEIGKSTLVEATARALFDDYRSTGEEIRDLQPWETTLAPEITLEFEAGGDAYRLRKRLLSGPECVLSRMESGAWRALHERDGADEFVRRLLHGEGSHGASDLRHWGLARMLWSLRDPSMIGRDDGAGACRVSTAVAEQLRQVLPGAATMGTAYDAVMSAVEGRYAEHFQPKRGGPKKGSRLQSLAEAIEALEDDRREAEAALAEVEQAATRLEQIHADLSRLAEEREREQQSVDRYRDAAEQVGKLRDEVETLEEQAEQAEREHASLARDLERYEEAEEAAGACREQLEDVAGQLQETSAGLGVARGMADNSERRLQEARELRRRASGSLERAESVDEALRLSDEASGLDDALQRIAALTDEIDEQREAMEAMLRPSEEQVAEAHGLEDRVAQLRGELAVAGLQVSVEALRDQQARLAGGETDQETQLHAGETFSYAAGAEAEIELPEVARILVRSGAREPAELQDQLEEARESLQGLLAPFAADSSAAMQDLRIDHRTATERLERLEAQVAEAAAPLDDADQLRNRRAEVRLQLTGLLNRLDMSTDELDEEGTPDLDHLRRELKNAQAEEDRFGQELEDCRRRVDELTEARNGLQQRQAALEGDRGVHTGTMTTTLATRDCEDVAELQAKTEAAAVRSEQVCATLADRRGELPSDAEDPERLMATAQAALDDIAERERELRDGQVVAQHLIAQAQTEGRYERLAEIEQTLATTRAELKRVWREAQAAKLLRAILGQRRKDAVGGQLPGLAESVARMLRHITGRERSVHMGEDMAVAEVIEREAPHDPNDLSSGTREQLDLVTRIALGETYAQHYGRTMMVLDDALLYTDPRRHDRIKQILQRAANLLQIFILTSHPDRYRGIVPRECQFDMEAMRSRTA